MTNQQPPQQPQDFPQYQYQQPQPQPQEYTQQPSTSPAQPHCEGPTIGYKNGKTPVDTRCLLGFSFVRPEGFEPPTF